MEKGLMRVEFELGIECKARSREEEKKKFQANRTARVKYREIKVPLKTEFW